MATYLHDIQSIRDVHPNLPAVLGGKALNRRIQANSPVDHADLVHAQGVATFLQGMKEIGVEPLLTDAIVQSAELRAWAIETAHATTKYNPVNLTQALQSTNNRLDELTAMIHQTSAVAYNNRIFTRNFHRRYPQPYLPLRKTIFGHGLALAQAVAHNDIMRNVLEAPDPAPAVNTIPQNFNPDTPSYDHVYILQLIIFYNDDFGILQGDTLLARIEKFLSFLIEI